MGSEGDPHTARGRHQRRVGYCFTRLSSTGHQHLQAAFGIKTVADLGKSNHFATAAAMVVLAK